jgi:5-methyltetrahydropteroyltriglutamate--homocysteine methyltransferase
MSVDEFFGNEEKFVLTRAELLHQEAVALAEAGATWIQIDEPCLCVGPEKIDLAKRGIEIVTRGLKAKTMLFVYFGSIKPLVPKLFDFPVAGYGVDCVSRPENFGLLLTAPKGKGICCGCLDGRNIKLETDRELFPYFEKLAARTDGGEMLVSPSSGLEFLPHADAVQKLERMVTAVRAFNRR